VFEDGQCRPDFVKGRRAIPAHLFGLPRRRDLAPQRVDERLPFERRRAAPVEPFERVGNRVVLALQRPPHHFGRVRGDHQFDLESQHRLAQPRGRRRRGQPRQGVFE
jgi:hypothetical protein